MNGLVAFFTKKEKKENESWLYIDKESKQGGVGSTRTWVNNFEIVY